MPQLGSPVRPCPAGLRDRSLIASAPYRRAIAAVRAGRPVRIEGPEPITVAAVETTTPELLAILDPDGAARLLISGERAAALSLANLRDAADPTQPVLIGRAPWLDAETATALADPGRDLDRGPIGPLQPVPCDCAASAKAALTLARSAGLLPALWLVGAQNAATSIAAEAITREDASPQVEIVARARLPLEDMPETQIVAFRAS